MGTRGEVGLVAALGDFLAVVFLASVAGSLGASGVFGACTQSFVDHAAERRATTGVRPGHPRTFQTLELPMGESFELSGDSGWFDVPSVLWERGEGFAQVELASYAARRTVRCTGGLELVGTGSDRTLELALATGRGPLAVPVRVRATEWTPLSVLLELELPAELEDVRDLELTVRALEPTARGAVVLRDLTFAAGT